MLTLSGNLREMVAQGLRITGIEVAAAVAHRCKVPVSDLDTDDSKRLLNLEERLAERIIGQSEAIRAVSEAIRVARAGLGKSESPLAGFLFVGPSGVGKTELSKALAQTLFGDERHLIRMDMSEFMEAHSVAKMIGAPPGFIGHEQGGNLTEQVRSKPSSVVLLDEVEKAHPRILDILLQVIEEGRLTDGRGNTTYFSETVIILTSNLGSHTLAVPVITDEVRDEAMEEVRTYFRPEFLNRLDEIIMFNALTDEDLYEILKLNLRGEQKLGAERGLKLEFTEAAMQWMLAQNDEPEYGARPLRRIIRRSVREPLADFLLRANPPAGTQVTIDAAANGDGLEFSAVVDGKEIKVGV
jgi:ATP-dependent Clp protease ATP-binding subunit ClpB